MPDEVSLIKLLSTHYPVLVTVLTAISGIVYATLKVNRHFARLEVLEREMIGLRADWVDTKTALARVILTHCKRHPEDLDRLMKDDEKEEKKNER